MKAPARRKGLGWTFTKSRHRNALVSALSCSWGSARYATDITGWNATIGLGVWSLHASYRWLLPTTATP